MRVRVKGKMMSFDRRLWIYFLLAVSFVNTTTLADTAGGYTDKDTNCPGWAYSGECYKNPIWMKGNCAKSCEIMRKDDKKISNAMKSITANPPSTSMESKTIQDFIEKLYKRGKSVIDMEIYKTVIKPLFLQIVKNPSLELHFPDFSSIFHHNILPTVIQNEDSNSPLLKSKLKTKFPKKVDESVQPQKHEVTINGTYTDICRFKVCPTSWFKQCFQTRWISTGFYAKQGQLVTVTVPQHVIGKFEIRVGTYNNNLYSKNKIRRSKNEEPRRPCYISQLYGKNLIKRKTRLLSAYGGYIYVVIKDPSELGKFTLKFDKVIKSPTYVHGKTKKEEWEQLFASSKSPEVEIETSGIIVTIAREDIIKHRLNIPMIGKQFTQVMEGFYELQGYTLPSPHRYVYSDPDISCTDCGAFSGYPIKDLSWIKELKNMSDGHLWLIPHEIGHNAQQEMWNPDGITQVSNEIFTLYVNEVTFKSISFRGDPLPKLSYRNKKFTDLSRFGKLNIFKMVEQECSWTTYKKFFKYYNEEIQDSLIPKTDADRYVTIARVLSQKCNKDLIPFFQWWEWGGEKARSGLENAKKFTKNLPKWEGIINLLEHATVQRETKFILQSRNNYVKETLSELLGTYELSENLHNGYPMYKKIGGNAVMYFSESKFWKFAKKMGDYGWISNYKFWSEDKAYKRQFLPMAGWEYWKWPKHEPDNTLKRVSFKHNDVAYYGYDIAKSKKTGEKECASWCDENEDCKAWTLRKNDNMCWIKAGDIYQINQTNFVSCSKWCAV